MAKFTLFFAAFVAILVSASAAFVPMAGNQKKSALYAGHNPRVSITLNEGEPIENALKRFKRETSKSGHLFELRHKRYFENSQERKKRKIREAGMRRRMERIQKKRQNKFNA